MGFDINVYMMMMMCPEAGKPYYYTYDKEAKQITKVYEVPHFSVPDELRRYLVGRGHHFHAYTDEWNEKDIFDIDVESFLESYPDWDDVLEHSSYDSGWTFEDHRGFKRLLKWCTKQEPSFRLTWSY